MKANIKETTVLATPELISVQIGGRKSVTPKQVLMLVADINYTTIHLFNGEKFMIARTLKRVQQSLSLHGNFVRTNRKFVVNWDYVQSHCAKQLTLQNNLVIHFSRRQGKLVKMYTAK